MINIPKGTKDVTPYESYKWHYVEDTARRVAATFGYSEIRTPTFEHTELFLRGVGETTDIVNKEMYTFLDKGNRSMTLKCEGTAGVARSFIENGIGALPQPTKMYYITPVFRYERPQSGRLREHHQFGVELYGSTSPFADAEVILLAKRLIETLGITELELNLNSIGCGTCRKGYNAALKDYFRARAEELCPVCRERLDKNPLRILDCKEERCAAIAKDAPVVTDYLCDDCRTHFEALQTILKKEGVSFAVNPKIVRGLDYYTGTVFEFISTSIGAKGTVCGGGRYNRLVEEVGGKPTPAVGFGMGLERLIMVLEALGLSLGSPETPAVYVAPLSEALRGQAFSLVGKLRLAGISADTDLADRSFKAQMKYANKKGYRYLIALGEDELRSGTVQLKEMASGTERAVAIVDLPKTLGEL